MTYNIAFTSGLQKVIENFYILHIIQSCCKILTIFPMLYISETYLFRLKLKKVGKTTRLFRYGLNQIPYDYTVEVRHRFKGLDLMDRVSDELRMEAHDIVQEVEIKTTPKKKKCKKANGCLRRPYK